MIQETFTCEAFLSAAECNAQQEMSLPMLAQRLIDVATAHANALGIGYADLVEHNMGWVLSRMSIELKRFPSINQNYSITTWVESFNRHFSERNMEICDGNGEPIGYARTVWVAINFTTRRPADLSIYNDKVMTINRECPIEKLPRMPLIANPDSITDYKFQFSDIDFNRHVNSTRYIEMILNRWGVDFFDRHRVGRFDITYIAEAHYNDVAEIRLKALTPDTEDVEITRDGAVCTRARLLFLLR